MPAPLNVGLGSPNGEALMIFVVALALLLIAMMVILAYRLATYALPAMLGLTVARLADATGAGWVGAGIAGFVVGALSFCFFAVLFATARTPTVRAVVVLIFVTPAVAAGYVLTYGLTEGAIPSAIWRQTLCIAVSALIGVSAFARLASAAALGGASVPKLEADQVDAPDDAPPRGSTCLQWSASAGVPAGSDDGGTISASASTGHA